MALGSDKFLPNLGRGVTLNFNVEVEFGQVLLGILAGTGALIAALTYRNTAGTIGRPPPSSEPGFIPPPPTGPTLSREQFMAKLPDEMLWEIYQAAVGGQKSPSDERPTE